MTEHSADTVELKPCPFCGGRASMHRDHCLDGGGVFAFIECHDCRGRSPQKYYSHGNDCPQTYAEIRDTWNTRTALTVEDAAKVLLTPDELGRRESVYTACENRVKVYKFDSVLRAIADTPKEGE